MALTDVRIRQAKPTERAYRLADSGGLFLEVRPNGSKLWRYAYRIGKKQNLFAVGAYPAMSLLQARAAHMNARSLVKEGRHPAAERTRSRNELIETNKETFRFFAERWFETKRAIPEKNKPGWSSGYERQVRYYLDNDIYPKIGKMPVKAIRSANIVVVLDVIVERNATCAAILARQIMSQIFEYAIAKGAVEYDPAHVTKRSVNRPKVKHASPLRPDEIRGLLIRSAEFKGSRLTVIAMRLLLLLFVRTKELRTAEWAEVAPALKTGMWVIAEGRMKMRRIHMVPIAPQALQLLKELHGLTGHDRYLFPSSRKPGQPMGPQVVNSAIRRMGYPMAAITGHDFRATASTLLNEMGFRSEHVDMQLAHSKDDAYNHARYLPERIKLMQIWADYIDKIERGELDKVEDSYWHATQSLAA